MKKIIIFLRNLVRGLLELLFIILGAIIEASALLISICIIVVWGILKFITFLIR